MRTVRFTVIYRPVYHNITTKKVVQFQLLNLERIPTKEEVIKKSRLDPHSVSMVLIGDPDELE